MDNITHSLVGAVLGQTGLKRKTRKGMAALVLGANGPDIDVFFGWVPWTPLATHRGFTHGVIGALIVMPLVVAGFLWLLDRWQARRGDTFEGKPALDWWWLLGLAWIGGVTHPLLDWQTTYAVQLLSPFSNSWFHADTLFIIDLVVLIFLGGGFVWSRRLERRGGPWQRPAKMALSAVFAYIGLNYPITLSAEAWVAKEAGVRPDRVVSSPPPVFFWRRTVAWLWRDEYRWADTDLFKGVVGHDGPQRRGLDDPLAQRAIVMSPEVQRFLRWSIMPFAKIRDYGCNARVVFNDARYSEGISRGNFEHEVTVPLRQDCF